MDPISDGDEEAWSVVESSSDDSSDDTVGDRKGAKQRQGEEGEGGKMGRGEGLGRRVRWMSSKSTLRAGATYRMPPRAECWMTEDDDDNNHHDNHVG